MLLRQFDDSRHAKIRLADRGKAKFVAQRQRPGKPHPRPDEELTGPLEKSLRQVRRQREQ